MEGEISIGLKFSLLALAAVLISVLSIMVVRSDDIAVANFPSITDELTN